ncbi:MULTISPECIES: hypothetical protein [unclassified Sphingobacterium]|uniref:hypothetical protein n=1 Tax=unclassified Sphingobacterium TaxID=2609468 RepID=UPI00140481C9|nr:MULTISPECIES: hypothetical protein [unclassified Sphingobacterium]MCS3555787.1 hypothetical protein [Sphingobacterium sp. JUb21]
MKKNLYTGEKNPPNDENLPPNNESSKPGYLYPFSKEVSGAEAEITINLASVPQGMQDLDMSLPPLKYNKSLLFMLTQDDCKQSAFSMTWAAINGKPIDVSDPNKKYYYDVENLEAEDLPPSTYSLGKTLGSTDGFGNEVRFHFTTTLAPQWDFMQAPATVNPGYKENFFRFYMKAGLRWNNVREILNTGNGIAFHDLNTLALDHVDSLVKHFAHAQKITKQSLDGRGVKFFAEPNGDKRYLTAAMRDPDMETMVAQTGATKLIPYQVHSDLNKMTFSRVFVNHSSEVKNLVINELAVDPQQRAAVHIGVHETDHEWAQFLMWLNDSYGQEGTDVLWFPSQEEYYEYNYYRQHADVQINRVGSEIKIKVKFPNRKNFYFPALTLNISGLKKSMIASISSNEQVTGLTYGDFGDGIGINIDCRKFLYDHANHYVKRYLSKRSDSNLADALYHVQALKDSPSKRDLLKLLE